MYCDLWIKGAENNNTALITIIMFEGNVAIIIWKIENSDFLGAFQIYVQYNLKKQACNI